MQPTFNSPPPYVRTPNHASAQKTSSAIYHQYIQSDGLANTRSRVTGVIQVRMLNADVKALLKERNNIPALPAIIQEPSQTEDLTSLLVQSSQTDSYSTTYRSWMESVRGLGLDSITLIHLTNDTLNLMRAEVKQQKYQADLVAQAVDASKKELSKLQADIVRENEEQETRRVATEKDIGVMTQQLTELKRMSESSQANIAQTQRKTILGLDITQLEGALDQRRRELKRKDEQLKSSEEAIQENRSALENSKTALSDKQDEVNAVTLKLKALEKRQSSVKKIVSKKSADEIARQAKTILKLRAKILKREKQADASREDALEIHEINIKQAKRIINLESAQSAHEATKELYRSKEVLLESVQSSLEIERLRADQAKSETERHAQKIRDFEAENVQLQQRNIANEKEQARMMPFEELARVQKEDLESFQQRYNSLQHTEAGLHEQIGSLQSDVATCKYRQGALEEELQILKIENNTLRPIKAEHGSCAGKQKAFEEQYRKKDTSIDNLGKELDGSRIQLEKVKGELLSAQGSVETLTSTNERHVEENSELLSRLSAHSNTASEETKLLIQSKKDTEHAKGLLETRCHVLSNQATSFREARDEARQQSKQDSQKLLGLQSQLHSWQKTLVQAGSDLAIAREHTTKLTAEKRSKDEQCSKVVRDHANCSTTLAEAMAAKEEAEKALTHIAAEKLISVTEAAAMGTQLRIVRADFQSLTTEHQYAKTELDQTRQQLIDTKGRLITRERTLQQLISAAETLADDAKAEADMSEENYRKVRKQLREEKSRLRLKHDAELELAEQAHNTALDNARASAQQTLIATRERLVQEQDMVIKITRTWDADRANAQRLAEKSKTEQESLDRANKAREQAQTEVETLTAEVQELTTALESAATFRIAVAERINTGDSGLYTDVELLKLLDHYLQTARLVLRLLRLELLQDNQGHAEMLARIQHAIEWQTANEQDLKAIVRTAIAFTPRGDSNTGHAQHVIKLLGEYSDIVALARTSTLARFSKGGNQGLVVALLMKLATMLKDELDRKTTEETRAARQIEAMDQLMSRMR